jgi:hypothetical protein
MGLRADGMLKKTLVFCGVRRSEAKRTFGGEDRAEVDLQVRTFPDEAARLRTLGERLAF